MRTFVTSYILMNADSVLIKELDNTLSESWANTICEIGTSATIIGEK